MAQGGGTGGIDNGTTQALVNISTNGNLLNQNLSAQFAQLITALKSVFPVSGTLPVANGGTGNTTLTLNGVLYGNGASAIGITAQGASHSVLTANAGVPSFSATPTVTSLTTSGGGITLGGGTATLAAGTTSLAPLTFLSGTNQTTAGVGTEEFDGICFYANAVSASRQIVVAEQVTSLTADYTLTDSASAQKAFNASSNGAVTLAASTAYEVEMLLIGTNTGTTSHTWGILFAGAATITAAGTMLKVQAYTATSNALTAESGIYIVGAGISSVTAVTGAQTSATENVSIYVRGRININGAGTLIPQVKFSAQPNGTEKILAGSFIRLWPIGSGSVTNVGNWS